MCTSPVKIQRKYRDMDVHVSCRRCHQCILARKRHWIGRFLAEEANSQDVWFVTLTYGGGYDNDDAYWINYSHAQLFFKKLRKAGHKFKYVIVGEHGTEAERAHFHLLLFWHSDPPDVEMNINYQWDVWDHGHSYIEKPRSKQGCAVYLMDYLNKDNLHKSVMKYSKNPMLGQEYMCGYAEKHADEGLSLFPQDATFTIPGNLNKHNKLFYYPVGRETATYEKMLMAYLVRWAVKRPEQAIPLSEDVTEFLADICQDVHLLPAILQQYIARHYGYHAVPDICYDVETHYAVENAHFVHRGRAVRGEIHNDLGETIWVGNLLSLAESASQARLKPDQLRRALQIMYDNAPKQVRPYLQELYDQVCPESRSRETLLCTVPPNPTSQPPPGENPGA